MPARSLSGFASDEGSSTHTSGDPFPQIGRGSVIAPAPTALTDTVFVTMDGFTAQFPFEVPPRMWDARADGSLPQVGDKCCLIFDGQSPGDPWMVVWG